MLIHDLYRSLAIMWIGTELQMTVAVDKVDQCSLQPLFFVIKNQIHTAAFRLITSDATVSFHSQENDP